MLHSNTLLTILGLAVSTLAAGCVTTSVPSSNQGEASSCEDKAKEMTQGCDASRECNYALLAGHCSANTKTTTAVLDCLDLASGCHTPFDPGNDEVKSCLDRIFTEEPNSNLESVGAKAEALCGPTNYNAYAIRVFAVTGSDPQIEALANCLDGAPSCDAAVECLMNENFGLGNDPSCSE